MLSSIAINSRKGGDMRYQGYLEENSNPSLKKLCKNRGGPVCVGIGMDF